jgi:hypothetical protein
MTFEEKMRREIDAIRSEVRTLRNAMEAQNKVIQAIASKVAEVRGMITTLANRPR